jgi:6-pyruvoyltetrahydropterin/6-carboxytetrahydropterin synthase
VVTICKSFHFDAAHRLPLVPEGHKCGALHGHTYRVEIVLEGDPTAHPFGWVRDYGDISKAWAPIFEQLDHRYLNDVPGLENPTTEVLAPWLLARLVDALPELVAVRVHESATTWCEARR